MPSGERITVRVVDDHPTMLAGIHAILGAAPDMEVIGLHATPDEVPAGAGSDPADVVLLDLHLGRTDELTTPWIPRLMEQGSRVLLYTSIETPAPLRAAVGAGASGLCLKNDPEVTLVESVRLVAAGEFACSSGLARALLEDPQLIASLTAREVEVVRNLDDGLTHHQIARRLHIEPSTVKQHLKSVRRKYLDLGRPISNAHSIAREARHEGWLD